MMGRAPALLLLLCVSACGGDDTPIDGDASTDADGAADGGLPAVAEPSPPVLTPCPPGWRVAAGDDGIEVCEPFASDAPADCADYEVDLPGQGGCAPLDDCPAGDFSEALPSDVRVIYVRPGPTGGDGSEAAPYGTISEALVRAEVGDVIALAKGTYDTLIRLPAGVTLHGACAAETILTTTITLALDGLVDVAGPGSALRHLSIEGIARAAISVGPDGSLEIEDVYIRDVTHIGIFIYGGEVLASGLAIDGVVPSDDEMAGRGIDVNFGGSFEGNRVSVRRAHDVGVRSDASRVGLADFVIDEIAPDAATGTTGAGLQAYGDAETTLTRGYVGHAHQEGLFVYRAALTGEHLVIRDVVGRSSDGAWGAGVIGTDGATITLDSVLVERTTSAALAAETAPTSLQVEDVVLRDIESNSTGDLGWGIDVSLGATATLDRVAITRAQGIGLVIRNGRVDLADVSIDETLANPLTNAGVGARVVLGSTLSGERVRIRGGTDLGLFAMGADTEVSLTDLSLSDFESRSIDGRYGRGINVELGATLALERAEIRRVRNVAIFVGNTESAATLTDVSIAGVRYERCADDMTCPMEPAAVGLGGFYGGRIVADGFTVEEVDLCGVHVGPDGEVVLEAGEVTRCEIGACVYDADYDLDRLTGDVRYGDNGTNLVVDGALPLPVPAPSE